MANDPLQLGTGQGNFQVGGITPRYKEEQQEMDVSPLGSFLLGIIPDLKKGLGMAEESARLRGAMDAGANTEKLEEDNPNLKDVNYFFRQTYTQGYNAAAAYNSIGDYKAEVQAFNAGAVQNNYSPEQYDTEFRKFNELHREKLQNRLQGLSLQERGQVIDSIRTFNIANRQTFLQGAAGRGKVASNNSINYESDVVGRSAQKMFKAGQSEEAFFAIETQFRNIWANQSLSDEEKVSTAWKLSSFVGMDLDDPAAIRRISEAANEVFGTSGVPLQEKLMALHKQTAKKNTAKVLLDLSTKAEMFAVDPVARAGTQYKQFYNEVIRASEEGIISPEQVRSLVMTANKEIKVGKAQDRVEDAIGMGVPLSVIGASGVSESQLRSMHRKAFPYGDKGTADALQYAAITKDALAYELAYEKLATESIRSAQFAISSGLEEMPEEVAKNMGMMISVLRKNDDPLARQVILSHMPDGWKDIFETTLETNSDDVTNKLFADLRVAAKSNMDSKVGKIRISEEAKDVNVSKVTSSPVPLGQNHKDQEAQIGVYTDQALKMWMKSNPSRIAEKGAASAGATALLLEKTSFYDYGKGRRGAIVDLYGAAEKNFQIPLEDRAAIKNEEGWDKKNLVYSKGVQQDTISWLAAGIHDKFPDISRVDMAYGSNYDGGGVVATVIREGNVSPIRVHFSTQEVQEAASRIHKEKLNRAGEQLNNRNSGLFASASAIVVNASTGVGTPVETTGRNSVGINVDSVAHAKQQALNSSRLIAEKPEEAGTDETGKKLYKVGLNHTVREGEEFPTINAASAMKLFEQDCDNIWVPMTSKAIKDNKLPAADEAFEILFPFSYHNDGAMLGEVAQILKRGANIDEGSVNLDRELYKNSTTLVRLLVSQMEGWGTLPKVDQNKIMENINHWLLIQEAERFSID